ncbi:hypothetical protein CDL12_26943 [Handroanthus impetiginosus]|uniref:Vacuolar iron transporter n=1 Tax=Handroanthus impetiginosus TaxID=429701 RepID=A0A2G9G5Y8_9LAMI|nr:hypothetical protein CDL12_26943 [Handroanthus impetiginosus]
MAALDQVQIVILKDTADQLEEVDYSERAHWLRAAVLGANDGLASIASLMIQAVKNDAKSLVLTGFVGLFAGACSMAEEFVSLYSQLDTEIAQMKREKERAAEKEKQLPIPFQAVLFEVLAGGLIVTCTRFGLTKLLGSNGL